MHVNDTSLNPRLEGLLARGMGYQFFGKSYRKYGILKCKSLFYKYPIIYKRHKEKLMELVHDLEIRYVSGRYMSWVRNVISHELIEPFLW